MTGKDRRTLAWCLLLFVLPSIGFHLPQLVAEWEVPRPAVDLTLSFKPDFPKFGAASLAAMYHVAIAMALTITVCIASVAYCIHWLVTIGRNRLGPHLRWLVWAGIGFCVAISAFAACWRNVVDDPVTVRLFTQLKLIVLFPPLAFHWDAVLIGVLVFMTYNIAAVTVAIAVSTFRPTDDTYEKDRTLVQNVLMLMAGVLIAAMIAVKLRYDVGLTTLGAPPAATAPNDAYAGYQVLTSSIMTYMAVTLSLALAMIYLPGALILSYSKELPAGSVADGLLNFNRAHILQLLRAAVILSPPIINKLFEIFTKS